MRDSVRADFPTHQETPTARLFFFTIPNPNVGMQVSNQYAFFALTQGQSLPSIRWLCSRPLVNALRGGLRFTMAWLSAAT